MRKIKLVGGTNHGRKLTILHGAELRVPAMMSVNDHVPQGNEVVAIPQQLEVYQRTLVPLDDEGRETWISRDNILDVLEKMAVDEFNGRSRGLVMEGGRRPYYVHSIFASMAIAAGLIWPSGDGMSHTDASHRRWIVDDRVPLNGKERSM